MLDKEQQRKIKQFQLQKPHVVILGAGASRASFPKGDKNENLLPIMDDLIGVLDLEQSVLKEILDTGLTNFEEIYSHFHKKNNHIKNILETAAYQYFSNLQIPDHPTLYDHLLLSLTEKDIVATFNWDPLLIQAYVRNLKKVELPRLIFLHGNVAMGSCEKHKVLGRKGLMCPNCHQALMPSEILYPVTQKNYNQNKLISSQWKELKSGLECAFMITIFGYGAPKTDVEAIRLMKEAWGDVDNRMMEQTEIIDIKSEDELTQTWKPFIHTHHYDVVDNFYNSWIAKHPRKTAEAYFDQYWDAKFIEDNPIPTDLDFSTLWSWFQEADSK